jgi:hypothetical protein
MANQYGYLAQEVILIFLMCDLLFLYWMPSQAAPGNHAHLREAVDPADRGRLTAAYVLTGQGIRCDQCDAEGFDSGYHAEPNTDLCPACWALLQQGRAKPEVHTCGGNCR